MNDFTKEELQILFLELRIAIRHWGEAPEYKDYPKLKDKIQSMINSYCEHEPCDYPRDVAAVPVCKKCHRIIS